MSLSTIRYHGRDGERSARFQPYDAEPDLVYPSGVRVHYLATGAGTAGDFGLYRWTFGPAQSGPGPHFHRTLSESFYVLEGVVQLYDGSDWIDAGAGDFLHVPPGGLHGFRNRTDAPASMLLHFAPGTAREGYFEGLAARATGDWQPDEDELAAFYVDYDNYWVD